jgi:hypothetical protein
MGSARLHVAVPMSPGAGAAGAVRADGAKRSDAAGAWRRSAWAPGTRVAPATTPGGRTKVRRTSRSARAIARAGGSPGARSGRPAIGAGPSADSAWPEPTKRVRITRGWIESRASVGFQARSTVSSRALRPVASPTDSASVVLARVARRATSHRPGASVPRVTAELPSEGWGVADRGIADNRASGRWTAGIAKAGEVTGWLDVPDRGAERAPSRPGARLIEVRSSSGPGARGGNGVARSGVTSGRGETRNGGPRRMDWARR